LARKRREPGEEPVAARILNAAATMFSQHGFHETSMKDIAGAADVTAAALYYHYSNKQEILFEALRVAVEGLADACEKAVARAGGAGPEAALRAFVQEHVRYQCSALGAVAPVYTAIVYTMRQREGVLSEDQREVLRAAEARHFQRLRGIISQGVRQGRFQARSATLSSFAIIGMCEHIVNWARPGGTLSIEQIGAHFANEAVRLVTPSKPQLTTPSARRSSVKKAD
jgi:AcrR family transcriptional regulator